MKILLIRLDHLGDLVLTTPLIRALAKAGHSVEVITPRWLGVVLEGNPHVAQAWAIEDVAPGFPRQWRALARWIKAQEYDCLLLPNPKPRQLLNASWSSGVQRRLAMGARVWGRLTGHRCLRMGASMMSGRSYADLQLDFARALHVPEDGLKPDYFCRDEEIAQARRKIEAVFSDFNGQKIIGIHPGCLGNTCNLPSRVYGELASILLARTEARLIITGSASEQGLLESWPREVLESPRVYSGMGALDLRSLAALISQMDSYVIGSTGPLHLAAALGIRTLSPFCPLPPISFSVWGNLTGSGTCVEPVAAGCRQWRACHTQHCDFRGEVTAQNLWQVLERRMSVFL